MQFDLAALDRAHGALTPLLIVAAEAVLGATGFPTEPLAAGSGALFGWAAGTVLTSAGWTFASMIQYEAARRARDLATLGKLREKLPRVFRHARLDHPAFLICARWLPTGFHVANFAAGVLGVPHGRQLLYAVLGSFPVAALWAGIGSGVVRC